MPTDGSGYTQYSPGVGVDDLLNPQRPYSPGNGNMGDAISGGIDKPAAITYAGMGMSILGGIMHGMAAIQSGNFNADIADQNARLSLMQAGDARARGQFAASVLLLHGSQMASKQEAAYSGAGVDVKSGSAIETMADTKAASGFDALMAENNAAREAWGFEQRARIQTQQGAIDRTQGENAAGESILGGASGAATYGLRQMIQIA